MTAKSSLPLQAPASYRWANGLIIDNFAGGGGASTGIAQAIGRSPDIAVNHNAEALMMHQENHPETKHYNESVWDIDIRKATGDKPVLAGWFSPDCTHFSVAKGGKPVKKVIRGLAWIVKKWVGQSDMAQVYMENVKEFLTWGPLIAKRCKDTNRVIKLVPDPVKKDKMGDPVMNEVVSAPGEQVPYREQALIPDKKRAGKTFKQFVSQLRAAGYEVEWCEKGMTASDFGEPTTRSRFFLMARKDGLPIVWPEATHGSPKMVKANPELQLWKTAGDNLDWSIKCPSIFDRKKPLAEKTLARIFKGVQKFVIDAGDDAYVVNTNEGPVKLNHAVTSKLGIGMSMTPAANEDLQEVSFMATIDQTSTKDTAQPMDAPLSTVVSKNRHIKVAALIKHFTGVVGQSMDKPLPTITATDHNAVMDCTAVHIQRDFGNSIGHAANEPLGVITAGGGGKSALVASSMVKLKGTCQHGQALDRPLDTIGAQGNHYANVQAFLIKFYGTGTAVSCDTPLDTITSKSRFGIVTIHGQDYQIVDIGMRMLEPHELYRCQGFPADYQHEVVMGKKLPKFAQVRMVGNSVPPGLARALLEANIDRKSVV